MNKYFLPALLAFSLSIRNIRNGNTLPASFNTTGITNTTGVTTNSSNIKDTTQVQDLAPVVKQCNVSFIKMGCYDDPSIENSSFPSLILKPILPLISGGKTWSLRGKDWNEFLEDFVCSCAQKAKQLNCNYFGLKRFDQCWSGDTTLYYRNPASNGCLGLEMNSCDISSSTPCAGNRTSVFVYHL